MMNRIIAALADLEWTKVLMASLAMAGAYYFMMYDAGDSLNERIKQANDRLATANTKLDQTKKAMAEANRFEAEVRRLDQQFVQITEYMPSTMGPAELTQIVNQSASLAGVRVNKIEPKGPDVNAGFYESSRISVVINGNFAQILKFLEMISRVPKLLTFDMAKVTGTRVVGPPTAEPPPLTFEGLLVGYRYNKDAPYVEPKNAKKGPGVPRPPTAPGGGG